MKCAFIGLGVMGYPMAGYLQKAGHEVTVYNRTAAKAEAWVAEYGGQSAATPAAAAANAEVAFCCAGNEQKKTFSATEEMQLPRRCFEKERNEEKPIRECNFSEDTVKR